jgi:uncharacterized membrane protein
MKWELKRHLFALAMIVVAALAGAYFSSVLPDVIPSHFGSDGTANQWSPKSRVIALGVAAPVGVFLLLTFIPLIDPFWKRIQSKYDLFLVFRDIALGAIVYFVIVGYVSAKEGTYETNLAGLGLGLLFILMGNYLPKLPRNFFFGIRSPWTLASEQVWKRTHRVSGWLFVACGLIMAGLSFSPVPQLVIIVAVLIPLVLFCGFIYPYALFRKIEREEGENARQL